jgi:hypothetical protein
MITKSIWSDTVNWLFISSNSLSNAKLAVHFMKLSFKCKRRAGIAICAAKPGFKEILKQDRQKVN